MPNLNNFSRTPPDFTPLQPFINAKCYFFAWGTKGKMATDYAKN